MKRYRRTLIEKKIVIEGFVISADTIYNHQTDESTVAICLVDRNLQHHQIAGRGRCKINHHATVELL